MRLLQPAVHLGCAVPLASMVYAVLMAQAGANPVEYVIHGLGEWGLRLLLLSLAITPLRKFGGWAQLMPLRRPLGLWAFAYVTLHLLAFWGADLSFGLLALWVEILKRPYITIGMLGFVLLLPLVATSTQRAIKKLGGARWRRLHQLAYVAAVCGCLHFLWLKSSKNLLTEPLIYLAILGFLLGYRLLDHYGRAPRLPRKKSG